MKKILCCIIAVVMAFGLAACQQPGTETSGTSSSVPESSAPMVSSGSEEPSASGITIPSDLPKLKIGVFYSTFADTLGGQFRSSMESLSSKFNVEFQFIEWGRTPDEQQTALESALQTGFDGVLVAGETEAMMESCKNAGDIPIIGFAALMDNATGQALSQYSGFLGHVGQDDYYVGVHAADALYEAGCRKVGLIGVTLGISVVGDARVKGFKDAVEKHSDMSIIAEDYSMGLFDKAVSSFAAAYPEMDGMYSVAGSETIYQTIVTEGLVGKIKFATCDISQSTKDFFDNGTLVYIAGGQYSTIMTAFAALYNYLYDGTRLISDPSKMVAAPYCEIRTSAEFEEYSKIVAGNIPVYTPDEIAAMIKGFNPSFTSEDFIKINEDYSLEDVSSRHADLVG